MFAIRIWFTAFILNAVWELLHVRLYTVGGMPVEMIRLFQSIFFDAWIVLGLYSFMAFCLRDRGWYRTARPMNYVVLALLGAVVALSVEAHAVYWADRWEYRSIMPTIMGIGVSPLLQMMVLPSLTILLVARFSAKKPVLPDRNTHDTVA